MPNGQQLRVAIGMGSAAAVSTIVLVLASTRFASDIHRMVADDLIFVGKADLFVVLWLALSIANVARLRFFSPQDIGGSAAGGASIQVHNATAVLQNTLEQVAWLFLSISRSSRLPTVRFRSSQRSSGCSRWAGFASGSATLREHQLGPLASD